MAEVAVVFTAKCVDRIIEEGGTSAWRLDRNHARRCLYAICTRNAHADWAEGQEPHHSAFLIGKIADVVPCKPTPENNEHPENRYLIKFSEFARVNILAVWRGDRNPVKYSTTENLEIDFSRLQWEPMPETEDPPARAVEARPESKAKVQLGPLTMAEAKYGLALTFNVPPESIEITIRG